MCEGQPPQLLIQSVHHTFAQSHLSGEAVKKASVGDFDGAEGLLWTIAAIYHGGGPNATEDDPPYVREASERVISPDGWPFRPGKSLIPPRDPGVHFMVAGCVSSVDAAKAKWEEGAPARAAEWEKGAPARKAAEEVARLKAEIARVEQEEVDRQAALAKEAALEKLRIQEEEEEKQRKAEVTSLERDAAALREKLAAMKELMAMKAADPLAYAAACSAPSPAPASAPSPSPEVANWLKRAAGTWGANRKWCILKAKEAQDAQKSLTTPAVHDHSLSQADKQSWEGLRAPVQGVSISYAVTHFAGKAGISLEEAEAVLAHLKPADAHRANALLAQQVFARFAKSKGIPVKGAMVAMREWAEGRD